MESLGYACFPCPKQLQQYRAIIAALLSRSPGSKRDSGCFEDVRIATIDRLFSRLIISIYALSGATEIPDKLPAHLETTTRCYPKYAIYSDFGEYYQGQLVIDILESVDQTIRESHPDFEIYRRLKESGRSALQDGTFEGGNSEVKTTGNVENPGWKLDKWKFLPMLSRTLEDFPNMKWYVFAEGKSLRKIGATCHQSVADMSYIVDTYIVWTSMLQFLSTLDSTESVYTGMYMWVGRDLFPYGGAGFVVSRPALQAAVAHYHDHKEELENFVDNHFNGDAAIGKAMGDAGVRFFNAWPVMQADYPGWLTFDVDAAKNWPMVDAIARFWCRPVVTFHHVSQDAVRALWLVERKWLRQQGKVGHWCCLL